MNVDDIDVLAFRIYDGDDLNGLNKILQNRLQNRYGLVFLCGGSPHPAKIKTEHAYQVLGTNDLCLKEKCWNICYLGAGKHGFCLPWRLLAGALEANAKIGHFILSDADDQISFDQIRHINFDGEAYLILPQRAKRHFGKFTLERSLIEDIENAFLRVKMKEKMKIVDFQAGVFIGHRKLFQKVRLDCFGDYKWVGDILLIDQMISKGMEIGMVEVHSSEDHGTSTIFDYAKAFKDMLKGVPLAKMKELVDYSGIGLNDMARIMLDASPEYIPTLFKYSDEDNTDIVDYYINYIVECYHQVALDSGVSL